MIPASVETMGERYVTVEAVVRMTPRTFARAFAAATGTSPIQWLNRQRIAAAQELLENTDLSVEQVAVRVGFGPAVSLRARFTAVAGVAPSRYQRTFTASAPPGGRRPGAGETPGAPLARRAALAAASGSPKVQRG